MKKALETTLIILLFFFALIGVIVSIVFMREFYFESKYSDLYINNCSNVIVGMTLEEAKITMGGLNYLENEKTYTHQTSCEKVNLKNI